MLGKDVQFLSYTNFFYIYFEEKEICNIIKTLHKKRLNKLSLIKKKCMSHCS